MGGKGLPHWVCMLLAVAGQSEAYVGVQWPLQIILGNSDDYVYGMKTTTVDGWSNALDSLYIASAHNAVCQQCNGTMSATLTGRRGKYTYSANSVASAVIAIPKGLTSDEYIAMLNGGTGLAPVVCAYNASAGLGGGNFLCNILATTGALQTPDMVSSVSGTINGSITGVGASGLAGAQLDIISPLTLTQLGATPEGLRSLSVVNEENVGVTVQDEDGLTGIALSTFVHSDGRVLSSRPCSERNTSLLLESLATQIVGGDAVYCFSLQNSDVILVTAWAYMGTWAYLTSIHCAEAFLTGNATMTLLSPQYYDTTGTNPFHYAIFTQHGSLQCVYGLFQTVDAPDNNFNWAQLTVAYGFPDLDYLSCDPTEYVTWSVPYGNSSLYFIATPCGMPGGSCALNGTVTYLNIDSTRPNTSSLQLAPNDANSALIGPGDPFDVCLWLQIQPTPDIIGDGSQVLATDLIASATSLMYNSAKGLNHDSAIDACVAGIQADIGSLTIFNALSAGMSAVAAGAGVNAFRPPAFLARRGGVFRIFPALSSLVESALVNLATFTYLVALAHKGTSTQTVSWFDVDRNVGADYKALDVFVATNVMISGRASFYALQWLVLCASVLVSSALVMYRWHIRPAVNFVRPVNGLQGAPSSNHRAGVWPRNLQYSDAPESKLSVGIMHMGSAGSETLTDADSMPEVQLSKLAAGARSQ